MQWSWVLLSYDCNHVFFVLKTLHRGICHDCQEHSSTERGDTENSQIESLIMRHKDQQ